MTFYFKLTVGYDYYDVNPFEAFCYLGFKLCLTNNSLFKAVKSYLVKIFLYEIMKIFHASAIFY